MRSQYEGHQREKEYVPLDEARARSSPSTSPPSRPWRRSTGIFTYRNYPLAELVPYIDWTPFFMAWELAGKFPRILEDEVVGKQATQLYADAQQMLDRIVKEQGSRRRTGRRHPGLRTPWRHDDIEIYAMHRAPSSSAAAHPPPAIEESPGVPTSPWPTSSPQPARPTSSAASR